MQLTYKEETITLAHCSGGSSPMDLGLLPGQHIMAEMCGRAKLLYHHPGSREQENELGPHNHRHSPSDLRTAHRLHLITPLPPNGATLRTKSVIHESLGNTYSNHSNKECPSEVPKSATSV